MIKTIKLEGGRELNLTANAATPFRFKQLFNQDLLKLFNESSKNEENNLMMTDILSQLAYIMNKQAEKKDMNDISMDDFFSWMEDFEPMDFVNAGPDIINTYFASTLTSSENKKK